MPAPPAAASPEAAAPVEWVVRPYRVSALLALSTLAGAALLLLLVVRLLPRDPLTATLLGLATLAILAPGVLPIRCRVDAEGVARRGLAAWETRPWADIRRTRLGERGLFVSPFASPHRLDRFRGLFLPLPAGLAGRAEILERLRREVARHGL